MNSKKWKGVAASILFPVVIYHRRRALCRGESIESNFNTILYAAAMCIWNGIWKIYENA